MQELVVEQVCELVQNDRDGDERVGGVPVPGSPAARSTCHSARSSYSRARPRSMSAGRFTSRPLREAVATERRSKILHMPVGTRGPDDPPYVPRASPDIVRATKRLEAELVRRQRALDSIAGGLSGLRLYTEAIRQQTLIGPTIAKQLQTASASEALRRHAEFSTRIANQLQSTARISDAIRQQTRIGPTIAKQLQTASASEALRRHAEFSTRIANQLQSTARISDAIRQQTQIGPTIAKQLQTASASEALRRHAEFSTRIANQLQSTARISDAIRQQMVFSTRITTGPAATASFALDSADRDATDRKFTVLPAEPPRSQHLHCRPSYQQGLAGCSASRDRRGRGTGAVGEVEGPATRDTLTAPTCV